MKQELKEGGKNNLPNRLNNLLRRKGKEKEKNDPKGTWNEEPDEPQKNKTEVWGVK